MNDPLPHHRDPVRQARTLLARKRFLATLVVMTENLTASLWRAAGWCALFAGLWMLRLPLLFGTGGAVAALLLFLLGLLWFLQRDGRYLRLPARGDIDRRLESAAGMTYRPLEILDDNLANPDGENARNLWQAQKDKIWTMVGALRLPVPRAVVARHDPWGLRVAAWLLLVIGLVVAGPQATDRIKAGLSPYAIKMPGHDTPYLTLWITPPAYTAQQRLTIEGNGPAAPVAVPAGSILKARVNRGWGRPVLHMGGQDYELPALDKNSWGIEKEMLPGQKLTVTQWGIPRATVPYELLPDHPPSITVNGDARVMEKAEIQFDLTLNDDYGVTEMTMAMDLDPVVGDGPLGHPFTENRAIMSGPGADFTIKPLYDLAWHPWAGLPVNIVFTVRDHMGQETTSGPLAIVLPERAFRHPVAAALAGLRRQLIWSPDQGTLDVAENLLKLMIRPESYGHDPVVFLSMRSMVSRLQYDPAMESVAAVIAQLWDTAIRIEDGNLSMAARELRAARAALEQLLADPDADQDEISAAIDKMRGAMNDYFRELSREMQKRFAQGEMMALSPELFDTIVDPEALAQFLDQLQAQALGGDKDAARKMLSQLQRLMDNLDPSTDFTMPPQIQFMQQGVSELQDLIEKQRALLDITEGYFMQDTAMPPTLPEFMPLPPDVFSEWGEESQMPPAPQWTQPPAQKSVNTQAHVVEQDALRYILGKLMVEADEHLGGIPEKMGLAEQEMRLSAQQLMNNDPALSAPHQEQAIQYLQEAMQEMSQQMAQMMRQMMFLSVQGKTDPLGRPLQEGQGPSWLPGSQVKIPDEAERKRVQEIQKLLRDRAGERERPDYELDYFRRLLKQF